MLLALLYLNAVLPRFIVKFCLSRREALKGRADILLPLFLGLKCQDTIINCYRFRVMPMIAANCEFRIALWEQAEIENGFFLFDLETFRRKGMLQAAGYAILEIQPATSLYEQLTDLRAQWDAYQTQGLGSPYGTDEWAVET